MNPGVLLIGGTGRCGSTMLLRLLELHPELEVMHDETHPHPYRWHEWKQNRLVPAMRRAEGAGKKWVVEKSPANAIWAPAVMRRLRKYETRYLHISRNKDACVDSIMRFGRYPMEHYGNPTSRHEAEHYYDWVNARGTGIALSLGERGLVLSYDGVLRYPDNAMDCLMGWLGVHSATVEMRIFPFDASKAA